MSQTFPAYPPAPSDVPTAAVVRTGLFGAAIGVGIAWWVVFPAGWASAAIDSAPVALGVDLIAAASVIACLLLAVRVRFAGVPRVRRPLPRIARLVVIAGVLSIAPTALIAGAAGYSLNTMVLTLEVAVVAALVSTAIVIGYVRTPSPLR